MKKKIFPLLLSVLALTGCDLLTSLVPDFLNPFKKDEEQGQNQQQDQGIDGEYTKEIMTSGEVFVSNFTPGFHFDTEGNIQKLSNYFDNQAGRLNLLSTIETDNLQVQTFKTETYLQFGSGSNAVGSLKWTSVEKIYKVEINVLCYAKEDTHNNITNVDNWSHIAIDDKDFDLTYMTGGDPAVMTFSEDYSEGTTEFTIKSSLGRVYMKSMKITWRS